MSAEGSATVGIENTIYALDKLNGTPEPMASGISNWVIHRTSGVDSGTAAAKLVLSDYVGGAAIQRNQLASETLRIANGSQNHVRMIGDVEEWTVRIADGNFDIFPVSSGSQKAVRLGILNLGGKLVTAGPNDSGGAGYRQLLIPNA